MGQLSKRDAERKRDDYISKLTEVKKNIREDFEEMDFENAVQRNIVEGYIESIETEFGSFISTLQGMSFS